MGLLFLGSGGAGERAAVSWILPWQPQIFSRGGRKTCLFSRGHPLCPRPCCRRKTSGVNKPSSNTGFFPPGLRGRPESCSAAPPRLLRGLPELRAGARLPATLRARWAPASRAPPRACLRWCENPGPFVCPAASPGSRFSAHSGHC